MPANRKLSGEKAAKYVEYELKKRGYQVSLPIGNAARTDLSVESPSGQVFRVKVTSLTKRNFWLINNGPSDEKRYFILVFMPGNKPCEFSILNAVEMKIEKQNYINSRKKPLIEYKNLTLEKKSLSFDQRLLYKDKWSSLPK
jgi:hypothetical protein